MLRLGTEKIGRSIRRAIIHDDQLQAMLGKDRASRYGLQNLLYGADFVVTRDDDRNKHSEELMPMRLINIVQA